MVEVPRLSFDALRELRGLIDAQRVSSSPSSETTRTGGGDDGTTARWRQLDLLVLATSAIQRQRLDPMVRSEVTGLLKLLLDECSAALAKAKEADDE